MRHRRTPEEYASSKPDRSGMVIVWLIIALSLALSVAVLAGIT